MKANNKWIIRPILGNLLRPITTNDGGTSSDLDCSPFFFPPSKTKTKKCCQAKHPLAFAKAMQFYWLQSDCTISVLEEIPPLDECLGYWQIHLLIRASGCTLWITLSTNLHSRLFSVISVLPVFLKIIYTWLDALGNVWFNLRVLCSRITICVDVVCSHVLAALSKGEFSGLSNVAWKQRHG